MAAKIKTEPELTKLFHSISVIELIATCMAKKALSYHLPREKFAELAFDTTLTSNAHHFVTVHLTSKFKFEDNPGPCNWTFEFSFLTNVVKADGTIRVYRSVGPDFPPAVNLTNGGFVEGRCEFSQQKLDALVRELAGDSPLGAGM